MEQLIIEVSSPGTSAAIKEFVSRFDDAAISVQEEHDDDYYKDLYGVDKMTFENNLNIGLAQTVLGITKNWNDVKAELVAKITAK